MLLLQMEYLAEILIKAEPLATGLAKDVHGQVINPVLQNFGLLFVRFLLLIVNLSDDNYRQIICIPSMHRYVNTIHGSCWYSQNFLSSGASTIKTTDLIALSLKKKKKKEFKTYSPSFFFVVAVDSFEQGQ